jgi:hypothetical protein
MPKLQIYARLAKVDSTKHEVSGIACAEEVDKVGEILDYAKSKPYFQEWSNEISKATDGKSLGNVRYMHSLDAVGKVIDMQFNDDAKNIYITAKIVDDSAWKKCEEGVLTGFSIGGMYKDMWEDGDHIRYVAAPYEVSVVDNPCVPSATFEYVKTTGEVELRKFGSPAEIANKATTEPPVKDDDSSTPIVPEEKKTLSDTSNGSTQEKNHMDLKKSAAALDHLKDAMTHQANCADSMSKCMKAMSAESVSDEAQGKQTDTAEPSGFNEGYKTELAELKKAVADLTAKLIATPAVKEEPKAARSETVRVEKTQDNGQHIAAPAKDEEVEFIPGVDPKNVKALNFAKKMKPVENTLPAGVVAGFAAR